MHPGRIHAAGSGTLDPGTLILIDDQGAARFGIILKPFGPQKTPMVLMLGPWKEQNQGPSINRLNQQNIVVSFGSEYFIEPHLFPSKITFGAGESYTTGSLSLSGLHRFLHVRHGGMDYSDTVNLDEMSIIRDEEFAGSYDVTFQSWSLLLDNRAIGELRSTLFTWPASSSPKA